MKFANITTKIIFTFISLILFLGIGINNAFADSSDLNSSKDPIDFGDCEYHVSGVQISGPVQNCDGDDVINGNEFLFYIENTSSDTIKSLKFSFTNNRNNSFYYRDIRSMEWKQNSSTAQIDFRPEDRLPVTLRQIHYQEYGEDNAKINIEPELCDEDNNCRMGEKLTVDVESNSLVPLPEPKVNSTNINFGKVKIGETKSLTFVITNESDKAEFTASFKTELGSKEGFQFAEIDHMIDKSGIGMSHNPGASKTYNVRFTPTQQKNYFFKLKIVDASQAVAEYIDPLYINFTGEVEENSPAPSSFEVTVNPNPNYRDYNGEYDPTWDWTFNVTGEANYFPWVISISTNCNGKAGNHNGNFAWTIDSLYGQNSGTIGNWVQKEWVRNPLSDLSYTVKRDNGETIKTGTLKGPTCYDTLPVNEDPPEDDNEDESSQNTNSNTTNTTSNSDQQENDNDDDKDESNDKDKNDQNTETSNQNETTENSQNNGSIISQIDDSSKKFLNSILGKDDVTTVNDNMKSGEINNESNSSYTIIFKKLLGVIFIISAGAVLITYLVSEGYLTKNKT